MRQGVGQVVFKSLLMLSISSIFKFCHLVKFLILLFNNQLGIKFSTVLLSDLFDQTRWKLTNQLGQSKRPFGRNFTGWASTLDFRRLWDVFDSRRRSLFVDNKTSFDDVRHLFDWKRFCRLLFDIDWSCSNSSAKNVLCNRFDSSRFYCKTFFFKKTQLKYRWT